ncbi:MAG: putative DNA-binding domain-containing protein [Pirellulales bacterium]
MLPKPAHLAQVQRWMQSVIMHPGGVSEGVDSPAAREQIDVPLAELESVIRRSRALSSEERLDIYVNAYYERLLECLREEFLGTRHALGDDLFDAVAFGYLQHYPSHSYTLAQLGTQFANYLGEARLHAQDPPPGAGPNWAEFIVELATFERAQREVFDAPGSERSAPLTADRLAAASADLASLRLTVTPCLRLCTFTHPVHVYWVDVREGRGPQVPEPSLTHLAVSRQDYAIQRHELSAAGYALLSRLASGSTLGMAMTEVLARSAAPMALDPGELHRWFRQWMQLGFFVDVRGDQ